LTKNRPKFDQKICQKIDKIAKNLRNRRKFDQKSTQKWVKKHADFLTCPTVDLFHGFSDPKKPTLNDIRRPPSIFDPFFGQKNVATDEKCQKCRHFSHFCHGFLSLIKAIQIMTSKNDHFSCSRLKHLNGILTHFF